MASLLSLPRELRDLILRHAIFSGRTPPRDTRSTLDRTRTLVVDTDDDIERANLFFERSIDAVTLNSISSSNLLLTNRQLCSETRDLLRRPLAYKLDLMHVSNSGVWPTWLSVPRRQFHVDTLHVNLRIFDLPAESDPVWDDGDTKRSSLTQTEGYGRYLKNAYLYLLAVFLQNGPLSRSASRRDYTAAYSAKTLILDVESPGSGTFVDLVPSTWQLPWQLPSVDPDDPAERLACTLARWLGHALTGSDIYLNGRILYQGFGSIHVRVDGEEREVFDLTDHFCRLPSDFGMGGFWPLTRFPDRVSFEAWAHDTAEKRRALGLWNEEVSARLIEEGQPECGLLLPGLWMALFDGEEYRPQWAGGHRR